MKRPMPYIPLGVHQQGRLVPTKLREADLDARQQEREAASQPLPELLMSKGAMSGPYRACHPIVNQPVRNFFRALLKFI